MKLLLLFLLYLLHISLAHGIKCFDCDSSDYPKECGKDLDIEQARQKNWTINCKDALDNSKIKLPKGVFFSSDLCGTHHILLEDDGTEIYQRGCAENITCDVVAAIASRAGRKVTICKLQTCTTAYCNTKYNDNHHN